MFKCRPAAIQCRGVPGGLLSILCMGQFLRRHLRGPSGAPAGPGTSFCQSPGSSGGGGGAAVCEPCAALGLGAGQGCASLPQSGSWRCLAASLRVCACRLRAGVCLPLRSGITQPAPPPLSPSVARPLQPVNMLSVLLLPDPVVSDPALQQSTTAQHRRGEPDSFSQSSGADEQI